MKQHYGTTKELTSLAKKLKRLGYELTRTNNNHFSITHPLAPRGRVIMSNRLGDVRAIKNFKAQLRRTFPSIPQPE